MNVYLAGGMKNNWREEIFKAERSISIGNSLFDDITFYNPCYHNLGNPKNYTKWDLRAIKKSDVVLAYMEKDNPSGYGLCVEVGYAKALGKSIIFVEDEELCVTSRYFDIVRAMSDYVFNDIYKAKDFLMKTYIR